MFVTARYWILDARARKLPRYVAAILLVAALSVTIPASVAVPLRDYAASPWQALWAVSACLAPACMSPSLDYMQAALSRPLYAGRLLVAVVVPAVTITVSALSASVAGVATSAGVGPELVAFAFVMASCCVVGRSASVCAASVAIMTTWVFGLDERTLTPHPWAVLLFPPTWSLTITAAVLYLGAAAVWVWRGST
jgi:hypothetical protein